MKTNVPQPPRPKVWSNFAVTLDGKISTRNLTPASFSTPEDKRRLTLIRSRADAIMVGRATLIKDNMAMGLPNPGLRAERLGRGQTEYPLRVIVSNSGEVPRTLKVFEKMVAPVVILTTRRMPEANRAELKDLARVHVSSGETVDLGEGLQFLQNEFGIRSICCEGGPMLFRSMLDAGLIDELYITLAPRVFGGYQAPALTGVPGAFLEHEVQLRLVDFEVIGAECFLKYRVAKGK